MQLVFFVFVASRHKLFTRYCSDTLYVWWDL